MNFLEDRSGPQGWDTWFLDLFVRCNNHRAIDMYEALGYSVYRRVVGSVCLTVTMVLGDSLVVLTDGSLFFCVLLPLKVTTTAWKV